MSAMRATRELHVKLDDWPNHEPTMSNEGIFKVHGRSVKVARYFAWSPMVMIVAMLLLTLRIEGGFFTNPEYQGATMVALGAVFGTLSLGFIGFAWSFLKQIPKGAENGRISLDEAQLIYDVGPFLQIIRWCDVTSIQTIPGAKHATPVAVWLATTSDEVPTNYRLGRMLGNRQAEPVKRSNGVLLPLRFFKAQDAKSIVNVSRDLHEKASII